MHARWRLNRRVLALFLLIEAGAFAACWPGDLDTLTDGRVPEAGAVAEADASRLADATVAAEASSVADARVDARVDAGSAYAAAVLADNPSAYWPLDDPGGSILATDHADGGGHPATPQGNVTFGVPGAIGAAVRLDGTSDLTPGDYFDILGGDTFAVELWARADDGDAGDEGLVTKGMYRGTSGYVAYFRAGPIVQFEETWPPDAERSAYRICPITAGFVHVVATLDGNNAMHLYVNGIEAAAADESTAVGGPAADGELLFLGQNFTGVLDEVALYDHPLTPERVAAHYLAATQ